MITSTEPLSILNIFKVIAVAFTLSLESFFFCYLIEKVNNKVNMNNII